MKRAECIDGPRPCGRVSCSYHMLWVFEHWYSWSDDKVVEFIASLPETCVLDVCDRDKAVEMTDLSIILGEPRWKCYYYAGTRYKDSRGIYLTKIWQLLRYRKELKAELEAYRHYESPKWDYYKQFIYQPNLDYGEGLDGK